MLPVLLVVSLLLTRETVSGFGMYEEVELVAVGGQWVVYNDSSTGVGEAPAACAANVGQQVPDSCCAGFEPYLGLVFAEAFAGTCNGLSLGAFVGRAYFGCDGGSVTYGEICADDGVPYPWPASTDPLAISSNVTVLECGCGVVVSGVGCWKVSDTGDGRQFYLLLAEDCVVQ